MRLQTPREEESTAAADAATLPEPKLWVFFKGGGRRAGEGKLRVRGVTDREAAGLPSSLLTSTGASRFEAVKILNDADGVKEVAPSSVSTLMAPLQGGMVGW